MAEQLCESCQLMDPEKGCFLREAVDDIVRGITPINNRGVFQNMIREAEAEIAFYKNEARKKLNCPNVDSVNPNLPSFSKPRAKPLK